MRVRHQQLHITIPSGTKVVTRRERRVGVVVHVPDPPEDAYRVRFPDGIERSFLRDELTIYRQDQAGIRRPGRDAELYRYVVYKCIVGSNAYGLAQEDSDVDRRGFYLRPPNGSGRSKASRSNWRAIGKRFTGSLRSSFDSRSRLILTYWNAFIRR